MLGSAEEVTTARIQEDPRGKGRACEEGRVEPGRRFDAREGDAQNERDAVLRVEKGGSLHAVEGHRLDLELGNAHLGLPGIAQEQELHGDEHAALHGAVGHGEAPLLSAVREPDGVLRLQRAPDEIGALHADFPARRRGLQLDGRRCDAVGADAHGQRGVEAGFEHGEAVLELAFPERGGIAVDREKRVVIGY